jgi:hypothetical protein
MLQLERHGGGSLKVDTDFIGKGEFTRAYRTKGKRPKVITLTAGTDDYSKEILAMISDNTRSKHLPFVKRVGYGPKDEQVFEMLLYKAPLRKSDSPTAWEQAKVLRKCLEQAHRQVGHSYHDGYRVNMATIDCAKRAKLPRALIRALELLASTAATYGSTYVFEFPNRNLATDKKGNLILLDVVFDREAMMRRRAAKRRRPW